MDLATVGRGTLTSMPRRASSRQAFVLALVAALAITCGGQDEAPSAVLKAAGPPRTGRDLTRSPTAAADVTPATLLARAVCWLDDPSRAAGCVPPSKEALDAIRAIGASGDRRFVAPLIDMRSLDVGWATEVTQALTALTGERFESDASWYDWLAANPQPLIEDYARWKGRLLAFIDPVYAAMLGSTVPTGVRPELMMWAGLRPGELPRLDAPPTVDKDDAGYLEAADAVYALQLGGIAKAYPRRLFTWHPVVQDQVGGIPVVIAYCGPCEAASAFSPLVGGRAVRFRDAGLWLDGRPLLLDEQSGTVWDAFSGRAVLGPLAAGGVTLDRRPLVTTSWGEWSGAHPATGVLSLGTGFARDYSTATQRSRDAAQLARFPTLTPLDGRLPPTTRVLGIVTGNEARAYVLDEARAKRIAVDTLGGERFLLLSPGGARAVRVYRPGSLNLTEFRDDFTAIGSDGRPGDRWWVREQALVSQLDGRTHEAAAWTESTWGAWASAYPNTSIWGR
ncbi:MAG: DUF3179 domain-containing protein [Dehalococcoidia bacterium]|nr:DUF3179 domain-containing protein [Dehalococcoidia bacterium]